MSKRPRLLRICPCPWAVEKFRRETGLNAERLDRQVEVLRREGYLFPGGWAAEMEKRGFEVLDILYPDIALLARWARENGLNHHAIDPEPSTILREIVRHFQPDVIFIYAGGFFHIHREIRNLLRDAGPAHMIITGLWGDELHPRFATYDQYFGDLDFVFATSAPYQEKFEEVGVKSVLVPASFDAAIAYEPAPEKDIDVLFCGNTGFRVPEHFNRYQTLKDVIPRLNMTVYADEKRRTGARWLKSRQVLQLGMMVPTPVWKLIRRYSNHPEMRRLLPHNMETVAHAFVNAKRTGVEPWVLFDRGHPEIGKFDNLQPLRKLYPSCFHKPVLRSTDYHRLLTRAKIVVNIHRDEHADIGNIRVFEATGVGSLLLTDRGDELSSWFKPDEEIVTFKTPNELVMKAKDLLAHPERIAQIAAAGQARALRDHTVSARCDVVTEKLLKEIETRGAVERARTASTKKPLAPRSFLVAKYDTQGQPISFDAAWFLQAADIRRKHECCDRLIVAMVPPQDIGHQPGTSAEVNAVVDGNARKFRIGHILTQLAQLMPNTDVFHMSDRHTDPFELFKAHGRLVYFPEQGIPHHTTYYQLVNQYPRDMTGFEASVTAHRYVSQWLSPIARNRPVLCLTLRQYRVDVGRNSNIEEWAKFLRTIDDHKYCVVVVPDTDEVPAFQASPLGNYPMFHPAVFDVDLRFALYEQSYLNFFVNNGPAVACSLNRKICSLMFKLVVPGIATTDPAYIERHGFQLWKSPPYAAPFQKWVWDDDKGDVIAREFAEMEAVLRKSRAA